jgi:fructose-bisphosphate aldolase class II
MIVSTKELFEHAYGKYAVGGYNINNAEQIMGLFKGNIDSDAPFIIQLSKGARNYTDQRMLEAHLTHPEQVEEFVKRSGCDSLACAIGTSHGAYKFSGSQGLHFEVIEEIARRLPGFPMVMHGSSSVPQDEVERINAAGGAMRGAKGVDEAEITKASTMGVTKVNIDTDGRLVWCRVHREAFRDDPENFDLRKPGKVFIAEYAKYITHKNEVLGSAGRAKEIRATLG